MSAWYFLSSGLLQIVFTKYISTKILIFMLISISSKSWGAALCGYGGRMFDTAVPEVYHEAAGSYMQAGWRQSNV
jgi:hypothetical protein